MVFQTLRQLHIVHKVANILEVHIFSPVLIQRHFPSFVKPFSKERFEPSKDWFVQSANFYIARLLENLCLYTFCTCCIVLTCKI